MLKYIFLILPLINSAISQEFSELSGYLQTDYRGFANKGLYTAQEQHYLSLSIEPKFYMEWANGSQTLNATVFARYDQYDDERTHADIRELYWQYIADTWEISLGLKKIYWGVIESNHLVDIINQTDAVESFDGEQKLGQPMAHLSYPTENLGTFDIFILPYFRTRTFSGKEGRLRMPFHIDTENEHYESNAKNKRLDLALRWTRTFDLFDIGISHFYGTNRSPQFIQGNNNSYNPYYTIIHQTGLDAQLTTDAILYKLEFIRQKGTGYTYTAFSSGAEYTFGNISNSGVDVGILAEYHFDDRSKALASPFDNDLFFGSRIALNDEQSTELLVGSIIDLDNQSHLFSIEGSRRFGNSWKLTLETRAFFNIDKTDFLYNIREDTFTQVTIAKYF